MGTVFKLLVVRFTMFFRSNFLGICKTIHFWNLQSMGNPKIYVAICTDTGKAVIPDVQNGRHKIHNLWYLGFYTT